LCIFGWLAVPINPDKWSYAVYKEFQIPKKFPNIPRNIGGNLCPAVGNTEVGSVLYPLPLCFAGSSQYEKYFGGSNVEESSGIFF